jgi:DNA-binding winged helix-turn-helix (wHTH) protein/Flp pilus assembly protein TadD
MKTDRLFRFGEYEVDALARTAQRQGVALALSRRAFDVLLYFVQNPGRAISKDELLKSVWADATVDENSLAQSVSVLRRALDEKRGENSYIVTLPGRGYQFISAVDIVPEEDTRLAPAGVTAVASAGGDGTGLVFQKRTVRTRVITEEHQAIAPPQRPNRFRTALPVALVLAVAALAAYLSWRHFRPLPPAMTVVLADLENTTGEADVDRVLSRALQIDLEQSPFLNLLAKSKVQETLAQMQRQRDAALTPPLAREICQRNNGQAILHATLSKFGGTYLLLLDAEGCISGNRLGGYKAEVHSKDRLLGALDTAAGRVRQQLGESGASRERFQMPIAQATTSSFDALRAYTQGLDSLELGDFRTAEELFKQAVALDPNFASAYKSLGTSYFNRADSAPAIACYKKAFELRERATERERLSIEVLYYGGGLRDYEESIRILKHLNQIYPNDARAWGNLCNLYTQLGEYPQAIEAGREARRLDPQSGYVAEVLGRAYKRAGAFAEAKNIADAAVAAGKSRGGTHSVLFQIAYAERDEARMKTEGEWGLTHGNVPGALDDLGSAAASDGRLHSAIDYFSRARTEAVRSGDADFAAGVQLDLIEALIALEEPAEAVARLREVQGDGGNQYLLALFKAETGDLALAQHIVATADPVKLRDTVHVYYNLPMLRALLALAAHRPAEAVRLLEPARPYQLCTFRALYLRARAETEAGLLDAAAQDYRVILANQGVDPISPLYSLSHLRLARVLTLRKEFDLARAEYEAFFTAWKNADADLRLLMLARREFAALAIGPS